MRPLRIQIQALTDSAVARSLAQRYAVAAGLADKASLELATAVSELATNVVKHAGTGGLIYLRRCGGAIHVVVDDAGPGLSDPSSIFLARSWPEELGAWRRGLGCGGSALVRLFDAVRAKNRPGGGLRVHGVKWLLRR